MGAVGSGLRPEGREGTPSADGRAEPSDQFDENDDHDGINDELTTP